MAGSVARVLLAVSVVLVSASSAFADDSVETQKKTVIAQILESTHAGAMAQDGINMMVKQESMAISSALSDQIDKDPKLSTQEKTAAKTAITDKATKRMERLKQLIADRVSVPDLVVGAFSKLYDKHFELNELKEMLAYFQSSTGQKYLKVAPVLTREALDIVNGQSLPKIKDAVQALVQEERDGKI